MLPVRIGLTGGVAMGKSSVGRLLLELGAEVISGDELGRIALEESPELLLAVRKRFGNDVFDSQGLLRRRELGKIVFASAENVRWLTRLTFPRIHKLWMDAVTRSSRDVIVLDAALIAEWGIQSEFDCLLVVTASAERVQVRLGRDARLSREDAAARQAQQIAPAVKAAEADWIIVNDGSVEDLRRNVEEFWQTVVVPKIEEGR